MEDVPPPPPWELSLDDPSPGSKEGEGEPPIALGFSIMAELKSEEPAPMLDDSPSPVTDEVAPLLELDVPPLLFSPLRLLPSSMEFDIPPALLDSNVGIPELFVLPVPC